MQNCPKCTLPKLKFRILVELNLVINYITQTLNQLTSGFINKLMPLELLTAQLPSQRPLITVAKSRP